MGDCVGFIGLGRMGRGMASNLARAGVELVVYDNDPKAMEAIVALGARAASGIADLARNADIVFTSLPGPAQVEEVVLGTNGLASSMKPGSTLFDLSTSSLSLCRQIEAVLAELAISMLDAPISGGPAGAASGDLALWIGGDRAVYDRHLSILKLVGNQPLHVGPIGAGTVTKLAHNLMGYMLMQSMGECFSLAVKAGMEPLDLWKALRIGAVGKGSPLDMLTRQFLPGTYDTPAFLLELAHKDVTLATNMARELRVPVRMADQTMAEMTEALARGFGQQDSRAFLKLQLERAGVEIAVDPARLADAVAALN
jgi:3-hydroxyisobutyrate dehydrogenase